MAKVVVTGGAGFIGSHLVDALVERGDEVYVVDLSRSSIDPDRRNASATYRRIHHRPEVYDAMRGASCVYHLAALPRVQHSIENPTKTFDVNVGVTQTMLELAREFKVRRVVYSSSSAIYGGMGEKLPQAEDDPPSPMSPYAAQKLIGEILCQTYSKVYGLETVCLRYFNVYGPRLDPNGAYVLVMGIFLRQLKAGEPLTITGDGTQTRDFTHVRDVVRANLLAASSDKVGKGEAINIGAGKNVSINRLAEMFGGPTKYIPARQGDPHDSLADTRRAKELLGWEPTVSIEKGVGDLKHWYIKKIRLRP